MKPTPRFLLAASMALSLAFTFSCSSDDSGGDPPEGGTSSPGVDDGSSSSRGGGSSSSGGCITTTGSGKGNDIANYKIKEIDTQVWMAENLDYAVECSKCYGESTRASASEIQANCTKYGRLYDWTTAMNLPGCNSTLCESQINAKHRGICPEGWHIPSADDWNILLNFVRTDNGGPPYDINTSGESVHKYLQATSGWEDSGYQSLNAEDKYGFAALPGGYYGFSWSYEGDDRGYWWSSSEIGAYKAYYLEMSHDAMLMGIGYNHKIKDHAFSVRCVKD